MPVYNGAEYVAEAIESVVRQEFPDWELGDLRRRVDR